MPTLFIEKEVSCDFPAAPYFILCMHINTLQTLALVFLILIGVGLYYSRKITSIVAAYKAKVLCSAVFVSGRDPHSVLIEDFGVARPSVIMRVIATKVDFTTKKVTANFLGVIKRTAVYRPGLGSTIVYADLTRPHPIPLPEGEGVLCPITPAALHRDHSPNPRLLDTAIGLARLNAVLDWAIAEPDPKHLRRTRAVVILHQGNIVAERYAPGFDQAMPLPGWSMAKGVINALVGILVGQGKLDLAAPAPVPEWQGLGDPRREITLDQLMRMTSGLKFSEKASNPLSDVTQMLLSSPNAAAYAANKPLIAKPGTRWSYASGTSNIISRIMRDSLGEAEYRRFPYRALFEPLGMGSAMFESDASGTFVGSSFLYASARDWAKFGQLYLQDGVWEGNRILPEVWVSYSTAPSTHGKEYGAHFWLDIQSAKRNTDKERTLPADAFHVLGYEGQCVSIIPSLQLVVVRLGLTRKSSAWRQGHFLNLIIDALAKID